MKDGDDSSQVSILLKDKQSIAICLPTQTTLDAAASALALYQTLLQVGKSVTISSSEPLNPEFNLPGQDAVKSVISADGDILIVSIPFKDNGVENVTYNIENEMVNIVIKPENGAQRFDPKDVQYSFSGGKPDVVVALYTPSYDALGELYTKNIEQFQGVSVVNIDRHFTNAHYGTVNFVDKRSPAMSLMVLDVLKDMKVEISKETATMLFAGIASATNNFTSHSVNAQTFKAAAFLLERGAEKRPVKPFMPPLNSGFKDYASQSFAPYAQPPIQPAHQVGSYQQYNQQQPSIQEDFSQPPFLSMSNESGKGLVSVPRQDNQSVGTAEFKEASMPKQQSQRNTQNQSHQKTNQHKNSNQQKPAQDWLKPQIFNNQQGNSRV